ncbi:hypothetical protein HY522_12130 [bacterium]|nr:hypothetical protein [bacterium]
MRAFFNWAIIFCVAAFSGCKSAEETYYRGGDEVRLIEAVPPTRPDWLTVAPRPDGRFFYFTGISENASTEAQARDMAVADALKKAAAYAGVSISGKSERITESHFKASETADPSISETDKVLQSARAYFSRFRADQYYVEHFGRVHRKRVMDSSFRVSVLLSIPADEVETAISESRKRHERSFDALWGDNYRAGVVVVNDGGSSENFDLVRAVLTEYLTQNNVLVVQNQTNPDPDHPLLGLKADYADNEDAYGMKSVTGTFSVRAFFKDDGGVDIVGGSMVSANAGAGATQSAAKKAAASKFLAARGAELLRLLPGVNGP